MRYNQLHKSGMRVSELSLGCEHVGPKDDATVEKVIRASLEGGVNLLELFMPQPDIRDRIGKVIAPVRKDLILMGHVGSCLTDDGQYLRCREVGRCERFIEDFLRRYRTDYIDMGMLHYVDTQEDYDGTFHSPVIDYAMKLKEQGKIRALGMSSHNAATALKAVETGLLDCLLFSVNPAQDLLPDIENDDYFVDATYENRKQFKGNPVREQLYRRCAETGTDIIVMKAMGCGRMLTPDNGLARPMTPLECIRYAATRPGVGSVLVGCTSEAQVAEMLSYENTDPADIHFEEVFQGVLSPKQGQCMYCNHCLPCPASIDIGGVTRAMDSGDLTALRAFTPGPADCIGCGSCEDNCPFGVAVRENMRRAAEKAR